jgi:hypothetical protein
MISKDYRVEHRHKYRDRENSWDFHITFSFPFLLIPPAFTREARDWRPSGDLEAPHY